jgi:tetratricopeptide (TPR) repeat protein
LADAIAYVHANGIVHRDIKPANVLLEPAAVRGGSPNERLPFVPKLTDFGLAKLRDESRAATETGSVVGTPQYMSPEQAQGRVSAIGPGADIYALGAILYELLTARPPVVGTTNLEVLRQAAEGRIAPPRRLRPKIPRDLEAVCLKCLQFDVSGRYASAADLSADLARFLSHRPVSVRRTGPIARLLQWRRRSPAIARLTLVLAVVLMLGVAGIAWQWVRAEMFHRHSKEQLRRAHAAVSELQAILDQGDDFDGPQFRPLRRQIAMANLHRLREIAAQLPHEDRLCADIAECSYQVAEMHFRDRDFQSAQLAYEQAVPLWQVLWRTNPQDGESGLRLAQSLHRLGSLHVDAQRLPEAFAKFEAARAVHGELAGQARDDFRFALSHAEVLTSLATLHRDAERPGEAAPLLDRASQLLADLLAAHPESQVVQNRLARSLHQSAYVLHALCRSDESLDRSRQAKVILQRLLAQSDLTTETLRSAAQIASSSARLELAQGQPENALESLYRARALFEQLVSRCPDNSGDRLDLGNVLRRLAAREAAGGMPTAAHETYVASCMRLEQLAADHPADKDARFYLAAACYDLAKLCETQQDTATARQRYTQALVLLQRSDHPRKSRLLESAERKLSRLSQSQSPPD